MPRCGRYFATGSADALVSVWDANELACIKTFSRLEWPVSSNLLSNTLHRRSPRISEVFIQVRTISFSHDGALLASASEDMRIDIGHVETTQKVDFKNPCSETRWK